MYVARGRGNHFSRWAFSAALCAFFSAIASGVLFGFPSFLRMIRAGLGGGHALHDSVRMENRPGLAPLAMPLAQETTTRFKKPHAKRTSIFRGSQGDKSPTEGGC